MNQVSAQNAMACIGHLQSEMIAPIAIKCTEALIDNKRASSVPSNKSVQCECQRQRYPELLAA